VLNTFVAYVEDKPGVLARVAILFRRRAFNIETLTVGHSETPGVSRMTIVVDADKDSARRIEATLYKLVNVLWVQNVTDSCVSRDLALLKINATSETLEKLIEIATTSGAEVVEQIGNTLILQVTGTEGQIDAFVAKLGGYRVVEMVRTGHIAMARCGESFPAGQRISSSRQQNNHAQGARYS
jgi:acetolactate synthase-1/3 small subunit